MWLAFIAFLVIVTWYRFEQHQARKAQQAAAAEPTRMLIRSSEPVRAVPRTPQQQPFAEPGSPSSFPIMATPRAEPPRVETLYLCKSYGGSLFWSKTLCHQLRATIDRIATVPGALPFDQQVAIARGEAQAAAQLVRPPAPVTTHASPRAPTSAECALLEEHIRQIDVAARQPQSGYMQDSLKDQRLRARSRQAQIGC